MYYYTDITDVTDVSVVHVCTKNKKKKMPLPVAGTGIVIIQFSQIQESDVNTMSYNIKERLRQDLHL